MSEATELREMQIPRLRPSASARNDTGAYADPYIAGVCLGLVLLSAFVLVGRGLGASGAFAAVVAWATARLPGARDNYFIATHLDAGAIWRDWLVLEIVGVIIGGWISATLAGRVRITVERGKHTSVRARLMAASIGGAIMGVGAVFARGCTSGLALTGGALLSVGSWLFIVAAFATAYVVAWMRREAWA
jgi:uncharacterized membrane protein YedE/YeeE